MNDIVCILRTESTLLLYVNYSVFYLINYTLIVSLKRKITLKLIECSILTNLGVCNMNFSCYTILA